MRLLVDNEVDKDNQSKRDTAAKLINQFSLFNKTVKHRNSEKPDKLTISSVTSYNVSCVL